MCNCLHFADGLLAFTVFFTLGSSAVVFRCNGKHRGSGDGAAGSVHIVLSHGHFALRRSYAKVGTKSKNGTTV